MSYSLCIHCFSYYDLTPIFHSIMAHYLPLCEKFSVSIVSILHLCLQYWLRLGLSHWKLLMIVNLLSVMLLENLELISLLHAWLLSHDQ